MTDPWSPAAESVWGKSRKSDDLWLRLHRHLEDSAAIAGLLWDEWVAPAVRRQISADLPGGEADGRVLLSWLAGVHDVGKATPAFAVKQPSLLGQMHDRGLACPATLPDARQLPHGLAGQVLITRWLKDRHGVRGDVAATFACVVGGHHGVFPSQGQVDTARLGRPGLLGQDAWTTVQGELLDGMADRTRASGRLREWVSRPLPATAQVLLTGLVIVADWLASDDTRFRYDDHRSSADRAADAWSALAMPPMWTPASPPRDVAEHLHSRFPGFAPRPVQAATVETAWTMPEPGLLVVEAPMGVGKTEAALLAAEVLAARFGCGGVFLALPTMATSDAMFARVLDWTSRLPRLDDEQATVYLAHGKARLNERYTGLARIEHVVGVYDDADPGVTSAAVLGWLTGRKKGPLASLVVGTIDQVLFGALQSKHLVLRQLALASKVVVIDEVHAADVYMRQYLHRVLHWLGAMGTPVVLLSATLPPRQRQALLGAYAAGRGSRIDEPAAGLDYPVVTSWSGGGTSRTVVRARTQPQTVLVARLDDDDLVATLREALVSGGCAAVIRNTVGRAQDTYDDLRAEFGENVVLMHSRFVSVDRVAREDQLRAALGPPGRRGHRPERMIVVGTQVLEQSLDIDVDLMISDLAPVDLLLQRMGRLHRHERGARPSRLTDARFLVAGVDWAQEPPAAVTGSLAVYRRSALLRAAAVLDGVLRIGSVRLPDDIPRLVASAYQDGPPGPGAWAEAIEEADTERDERDDRSAMLATRYLLKNPPRSYESLAGLTPSIVDEQPDDGRAQVRDSEDGIEVVVVQRVDGSIRVIPGQHGHSGKAVDTCLEPERATAKAVAACTLRLPLTLTHPRIADRVIGELEGTRFDGWQLSPWLEGVLVLVLDEQLSAHLAGHHLTYDTDRGLVVTRDEEGS